MSGDERIGSIARDTDFVVTTVGADGTRRQLIFDLKTLKEEDEVVRLLKAMNQGKTDHIAFEVHPDFTPHRWPAECLPRETIASKRKPYEPLKRFASIVDLVPVPGLRKKLQKFAADEQHEIQDLYKASRVGTARWREWCAWVYGVCYVVVYPVAALVVVLIRKMYTGG